MAPLHVYVIMIIIIMIIVMIFMYGNIFTVIVYYLITIAIIFINTI